MSNIELSILIEDEVQLLNNLDDYFNNLQNFLCSNWEITLDRIEDEIKNINRNLSSRNNKSVKYSNQKKWGANINIENENKLDLVEYFFKEDLVNNNEIAWLKFEGRGNNRLSNELKHNLHKLNTTNRYVTCFPSNPRGIEKGITLFICLVSYDEKNRPVPIIIGRTKSHGYSSENEITNFKNEEEWIQTYPHYVELYDIEILDTEIKNGISLLNVIMELKSDMYPTTVGENLSSEKLRGRYYRKSHIRVTPIAKKYLDDKLDNLFKKYGKKNY